MRFRISSALKDHIGRELITDDNVAIFEIVKNSYDADAKKVKIVFEDMKSENSKIYIIDNGCGMSKKDLEKKWLFLAFSEKKDIKINLKNKRLVAGSKGIGRFSCDRLGSKLKIYTKTRTDKDFNLLTLDWSKFERDQYEEFKEIDVNVGTTPNLVKDYGVIGDFGTIIEISDLRSDWDRKKMQKLKRYLQRLINPLQVPNKDSFNIELIAKDFIVDDNKQKYDYDKVNGKVENIVYEKLKFKTTTIECNISKDGDKIITTLEDKGIPIFKLEEKNTFELLRGIKVKISYLNTQAKRTFKLIMNVDTLRYGNIFVFKNGFRVLPYGETEDDWLELNIRKSQGYNRYLGTRELLGRIEINDSEDNFKESASRNHGLLSTPSFLQLKEFVLEVILKKLEKYVVGAIFWDSENKPKEIISVKEDTLEIIKQIAGNLKNKKLDYNEDFLKIVERKTIEKIPETIKNIENIILKENDKEKKDLWIQQIRSLKIGLKLEKAKQKKELEDKEEEIEITEKENIFLSGALSTDQEATQRLVHVIDNATDPIHNALFEINKHIKNKSSVEKIIPFIDDISLEYENIKYLSEILSMANFNTKVETIKKDLILYITQYLENSNYSNFKIILKNEDYNFVSRFKPLDIIIILNNFISNSKKQNATIMQVVFDKKKDVLSLKISDNSNKGGIKREYVPKIFNRAYTKTKGSGLGLYDIKKILNKMNGKVNFIGNDLEGHLKGACFEVVIKK